MSTVAYANENLLDPLGCQLPLLDCPTDPMGVDGGAGLKLRAREMAKLGYLYLDHGCWDGKRIVVEKWMAQSTEKGSDPAGDGGHFESPKSLVIPAMH